MIHFLRYSFIGLINTAIHCLVFYILYFFDFKQYICNFLGFSCAVIFSYFMNVKYNFKASQSIKNFMLFYLLMGTLSLIIGYSADYFSLYPLYTLILSSVVSLVLGYTLSKYFVFRG
ncbi:GtrA family protein [Acinetobacter indicus]|uniref:GtrA family protein n=1 Tax=Acinetobacter indicus TaxID=756892 RepID=UPI000CECBB9B